MIGKFGPTSLDIVIYPEDLKSDSSTLECIIKNSKSNTKLRVEIVPELTKKDKMFPNNDTYMRYSSNGQKKGFREAEEIRVEITSDCLRRLLLEAELDENSIYMTRVTNGDRLHISYVDLE